MKERILLVLLILGLRVLLMGIGEESEAGKGEVLAKVRGKLVQVFQRSLPEPEAGLVAGVVLGIKSSLTEEFNEALVETGTVHVVVASGYNVVVVGTVGFNLLIYLAKRKTASVGAIILMGFYALLAGGEPPVVRAVIMAGLVFVARGVGRPAATGWLLFCAASVMLIVEPRLLVSISFQLSVAATTGLLYLEPYLREWVEGMGRSLKPLEMVLKTELIPTLAAQISTGPIIWWYFGRISLISPLVNVLVLPLVSVMMALGAIQLLVAILWKPLGLIVAPFTYSVAHLFVVIVNVFSLR